MAEDWSIDVRKYAPDADVSVIAAIVRYCGIALQNRDSSLVSFGDPAETARIRENYLKKKLGLADTDEVLDEAIAEVGERMRADPTKNRVTVYYLLAEKLRKLSVFGGADRGVGMGAALGGAAMGGAAAATSAMAASAAATPAAAVVADHPIERPVERPIPAEAAYAARPAAAAPARRGIGWWPWLLLAALAAIVAWFLLANRRPAEVATAPAVTPPAATAPAPASAPVAPVESVPAPAPAVAAPPAEASGPAPAVTAGLPAQVHFALGSAVLSDADRAAINAAAAAANADGARLSLTGYTDRTGNLALNERLAQSRATAVRDALVAAGVPAANIEMRPPATVENGPIGTPNAEARRVEIGRL